LAIQGLPRNVCEWLSTVGTAPFVTIHLPIATCHWVSGSSSRSTPPALTKTIDTRTPNPSGHDGAQAHRIVLSAFASAFVARTMLTAFA
jgi:hypothetical protein